MLLRREKRRKIQSSLEIIPYELVIEILTRLPAKSLMRFKSMSKLWLSLICSQYFTNRFQKISSTPPRIYMWLGFHKSRRKNVLLSSSSSTCPDSGGGTIMSSFVVDQDLTTPEMEGFSVSQLFRGLMCFINGSSAKIYNTTTRQLFVLPAIEGSNIIAKKDDGYQMFMYHIGYDPVDDKYKVLCTVSTKTDEGDRMYISEHWVLLLGGGDGSWRKISSQCPPHRPIPLTQRLTINGHMHYLAWDRLLNPVLVSFDIHSEEISISQEPEKNAFWPHFAHLTEYGGRVAILHHNRFKEEGVMELWVMDDVKKDMWLRRTFELHPSQMQSMMYSLSFLRVQGTTRDGEVILIPERSYRTLKGKTLFQPQNTCRFHIFLYNLQNNHMRRVDIKETTNRRYPIKILDVIIGLDDIENLMYL